MRSSYFLTATGLDSVEGAPLPGVALLGTASFDIAPDSMNHLPDLRRWIAAAGGAVATETGSPVPVSIAATSDSGLYVATLGASVELRGLTGLGRSSSPCAGCRLPMLTVAAASRVTATGPPPTAELVSTTRATWLGTKSLGDQVFGAGLVSADVAMSGSTRVALWPDRRLASSEDGLRGDPSARRCDVCGRLVTDLRGTPSEYVPRYGLGLFVERPPDPAGWWWHARLGQHLPIVSRSVLETLSQFVDVTAVPVITDMVDAFLPSKYRDG